VHQCLHFAAPADVSILKRWLNVATPVAEYHNPRPDSI
jgi:hypothetical protein